MSNDASKTPCTKSTEGKWIVDPLRDRLLKTAPFPDEHPEVQAVLQDIQERLFQQAEKFKDVALRQDAIPKVLLNIMRARRRFEPFLCRGIDPLGAWISAIWLNATRDMARARTRAEARARRWDENALTRKYAAAQAQQREEDEALRLKKKQICYGGFRALAVAHDREKPGTPGKEAFFSLHAREEVLEFFPSSAPRAGAEWAAEVMPWVCDEGTLSVRKNIHRNDVAWDRLAHSLEVVPALDISWRAGLCVALSTPEFTVSKDVYDQWVARLKAALRHQLAKSQEVSHV